MKKNSLILCVVLVVAMLMTLSLVANAQDRTRRVSPAFPIGAGEKMIVLATGVYDRGSYGGSPSGGYGYTSTGAIYQIYPVHLPVGSTLKRVLGDFVDQVGADMTIELFRVSNADMSTEVLLRSFTTSGISSANDTDYKQVVANPLSHTMLQGWTYFVRIIFPGGTSTNELRSGTIKIIYEP